MYVIDAWSFLAWFQNERPAADEFEDLLENIDDRLIMSTMNVGEVYYLIASRRTEQAARKAYDAMDNSPVEMISVTDDLLWKAVDLKAQYPFSIADAFAGALALDRGGTLVSGDDDFDILEGNEALDLKLLDRSPS